MTASSKPWNYNDHINNIEDKHSLIKRSPLLNPLAPLFKISDLVSMLVHDSTKKLCIVTLGLGCKPFAVHKTKDILLAKKNLFFG